MGKKNKAAKQERPEPGELPPDEDEDEDEDEVEAAAAAEGQEGPAAEEAPAPAPAPSPAPAPASSAAAAASALPTGLTDYKRTKTRVRTVDYCGVSGVPFEYCEFMPTFEESKAWFKENYAKFYPEVSDEDALAVLMTRLGLEGEADAHAKKAQGGGKKKPAEAAEAADGAEGAPAPADGGKKKKKEKAPDAVVIELSSRNKKKHVTSVRGLEPYGVDMTAAAKVFGKKFACGCAFQKGKNGLPDAIEIQGNYVEVLPPFIEEKYGIEQSSMKVVDGSKKPKGPKDPGEQGGALVDLD